MSASEAALLISTRQRVVWTSDEKKLLNRLSKIFNAHGDKLLLVCGNTTCLEQRMILAQDQSNPGGMVLRCGCSDRCFIPSC
jgi:hypothetical protein